MASAAGGFIGMQEGGKQAHRASRSLNEALNAFRHIDVPTIEDQELNLLLPEYMGDYQAQMEDAVGLGPSAMEGVEVDPRLMDAQMGALEQISQMGETGLLPGERAALNQARRGAANEAQAKSAQLMDEYARRGMGGSGAELAARLQAGQSSADRMSQENDRVLQMAQERALGAIGQKANMASNISNQQFGQQADVAKAKDYISQFNAQNQQSVQQRNVANTNQGNMRNLTERQRVGEAGTGTKNQQQIHNKGLQQQQFQNQMARAQGIASGHTNIASNQMSNARNTAQMYSNMGQGVDAMFLSDVRAKEKIKPFDTDKFLSELSGVSYKYKEPEKHGEGEQIGILAQDLEKVFPQAVVDSPEGKRIDTEKLAGPIMANLAGLNERLRKLEGKE